MRGKATYWELNSVLSLEDLYNLVEMVDVEAHNARVIEAWHKAKES